VLLSTWSLWFINWSKNHQSSWSFNR